MWELIKTLFTLVETLLKTALAFGGAVVLVIGLVRGDWLIALMGLVTILLGQVVHFFGLCLYDAELRRWATEAIPDDSGVPPRSVRRQLIRGAMDETGFQGDAKQAYQAACRAWSEQQRG